MPMIGDEYRPTPAEEKLIIVLSNPEWMGKSIISKCREANVHPTVYYDAMKKPGFVAFHQKIMIDLVKASVGDIIAASIKYAMSEKANHQDRKMLLEMAGAYIPRAIQELTGKDGESLQVNFAISRPDRGPIPVIIDVVNECGGDDTPAIEQATGLDSDRPDLNRPE